MGYCMGGALSIAAAVLAGNVDAAAPFYGIPEDSIADPSQCKVPLQGHFGREDTMKGFSDPEVRK